MNDPFATLVSVVLLSGLAGGPALTLSLAQTPVPAPATAAAPPVKALQRTVLEDDSTRIEELRVSGQSERVVVKSKRINLPAWEIRPNSPARMNASDSRLPNDSANQRMWSVLSF